MLSLFSTADYQKEIQDLIQGKGLNPQSRQQIFSFLEQKRILFSSSLSYEAFFKGERAFFNEQYELALKFYLQATEIPDFQFFCYRASAFVAERMGNDVKALSFAQKALSRFPEDYLSLRIHQQLLNKNPLSHNGDQEKCPQISIGNEELDALNHIFNEQFDDEEKHVYAEEEIKEDKKSIFDQEKNYLSTQDCLFIFGLKKTPYVSFWKKTDEVDLFQGFSGGYFIHAGGKGVAINPGEGFFEHFYQQGFGINDLDFILITRAQQEYWRDVPIIENFRKVTHSSHPIHYYLPHPIRQILHSSLPPDSIFYFESNQKIVMSPDMTLNYFMLEASEKNPDLQPPIGIILNLISDKNTKKISYLSGFKWTSELGKWIGGSDLVLAEFGELHKTNSLGYEGSYSLIKEVSPSLYIACEFLGKEDTRLETIKKLRQKLREDAFNRNPHATILPGESGFIIRLEDFKIYSNNTHRFLNPEELRIFRSSGKFSPLYYLDIQDGI